MKILPIAQDSVQVQLFHREDPYYLKKFISWQNINQYKLLQVLLLVSDRGNFSYSHKKQVPHSSNCPSLKLILKITKHQKCMIWIKYTHQMLHTTGKKTSGRFLFIRQTLDNTDFSKTKLIICTVNSTDLTSSLTPLRISTFSV